MTDKNPLNLTISNEEFETTNFLTHDFDWMNPCAYIIIGAKYNDFKCKNCNRELVQIYTGKFNRRGNIFEYKLGRHGDESKTCNELLMESIIE